MAVRFKEFFFFYWGGGCPKNFKFLKDPWKKLYFLNLKKNPYNSFSSNCPSVYATHGQKSPLL